MDYVDKLPNQLRPSIKPPNWPHVRPPLTAGERLFTFLRYPPQQWKSLRTTNAIERLHGEFKRRVKTQCALPNAETAAMLFWALMASGQITMRRVGGWQTLDQAPVKKPIDLAAGLSNHRDRELRQKPISTNYRTRPLTLCGPSVW